MDIGSVNNNFNISYEQKISLPSEADNKLNLPSQNNNQNKNINQVNFQKQFKEVSKQDEAQDTQKTYSEISTKEETTLTQTKNNTSQVMKNVEQILQKQENQTINTAKTNIIEVIQDNQINKLKQQNKNNKTELQNKLLGEKKESSLRSMTLSSNVALFKNWFKKVIRKPGAGDDIEEVEEVEDSLFTDNEEGLDNNNQKANQIKSNSLVKQQKLFSLNMQSSLRYLKNLKTFNQRYSPEILIYDDETGFIDAKETLECLGWDDIEQFRTKLNKELNLTKLKEIHNNNKILDVANNSGLNVYKANHPLHNEKRVTLAIASLTGDITMIEQLDELEKLELQGKIYKIYNVSE